MLSILIPLYNFDCYSLVEALSQQAQNIDAIYEILVMDDCSTHSFDQNQKIAQLPNCRFIRLSENVGRAEIRNRLAAMAKYDYLLFLDCDSAVISNKFIERYISFCNEKDIVVCGGRVYESHPPKDKNLFLHWYYGSKREVISVDERQKNPYRSFMSNNFLISKSLFDKILFNEKIRTYGHEDSLFGYEIKKRNVTVYHIDNPLMHVGLEPANRILEKEKESVGNLILICNNLVGDEELAADIKLLRYALLIKKLHLCGIISILHRSLHRSIEANVLSDKPSLFLLDVYKLGHLCSLQKLA